MTDHLHSNEASRRERLSFSHVLRRHLPFIVIMPLLLVVMTWPTLPQILAPDSNWLVGHGIDWHMLFWDAWYAKRILAGQADFFYTDLKFYPAGVSLVFHNFSVSHMFLFAGLQALLPAANAYNLTYLILSFVTAASGYLYLHYLFKDQWLALFGSIVFGMSGFVLAHPAHPNINFIATAPLTLYLSHRAFEEASWKFAILAGVSLGITAFIGMYTLVCLLLTLALFVPYFALRRWRDRSFWLSLAAICLVAGLFVGVRFYPMIADPAGLAGALTKADGAQRRNDLLGSFINAGNPVTGPLL